MPMWPDGDRSMSWNLSSAKQLVEGMFHRRFPGPFFSGEPLPVKDVSGRPSANALVCGGQI
jgi:hypothetical protein